MGTGGGINLILGLWLIISPWIYGNAIVRAILWDDITVGAVIVVLGSWSALATEGGASDGRVGTAPVALLPLVAHPGQASAGRGDDVSRGAASLWPASPLPPGGDGARRLRRD